MGLEGNIWGVIGAALLLINTLISWRVSRKVTAVHSEMNGMKDALVKETGRAAHAEGLAEGKAQGPHTKEGS